MSIKIPVEAKFDTGDVSQATAKLVQQINAVGKAVAEANKVKYSPISKASIDDLKKMQAQYENLQKISGAFNSKLKATGQKGQDFFSLDWSKMYADPAVRARAMRQHFEYVTGRTFTTPTPPGQPPAPPNQPPTPPTPPQPPHPPGPGSSRVIGRQILASGLNAAGPVGGVTNTAIGMGMSGGVISGLAGLAGGLVALAVGKAVGGVRDKIGDAEQEAIRYDTLKRTLGDVNVGFNLLRESLRTAAKEVDITFEEGQRLGLEFAKSAGLHPDDADSLAEDVFVNTGFARAFGLDPSQSNNFFGQMREMGVTRNANDSRALALMIGEAIDKSGTFAKADEVLAAIANFTQQQTRLGLTAANTSGYSSMLTGLMGSGIPGLDPQGAAMMLGRVNASIQAGGAAGEAGQNFTYAALGRRLGLDPIQTRLLQEQGAFGTGADTFKSGGVYDRYQSMFGGSSPGTASGSAATNLQMLMDKFKEVYAGRPELMASAMSNYFGINTSQAMALATTAPADLGGVMGRLGRQGVDLSKVNAKGISTLARINSGDRSTLDEVAGGLFNRIGSDALSDKDARRLRDAMASGNEEQMRDVLSEHVATRDQEKTEGSETRRTIVGVQNELQELAAKMIPLMNDMRAGILLMAGGKDKLGPMGIRLAVAENEANERKAAVDAGFAKRIKTAQDEAKLAKAESERLRQEQMDLAKTGQWANKPLEERQAHAAEVERLQQVEADATARAQGLQKEREAASKGADQALQAEQAKIRSEFEKSPGASSGPVSGTMKDAVQELERLGWTREQAIGIVANLQAESGMRTDAVGDNGKAHGVAQWHPDRQAKFKELFGIDVKDATLKQQLAFVDWELRNTEKAAGNKLKNATSVEEASTIVQRDYERPAQADDAYNKAKREGIARDLYASMQESHSTPLPSGAAASTGGTGSSTLNVHVTGTINNTEGKPVGVVQPTTVATRTGAPTPSGAVR